MGDARQSAALLVDRAADLDRAAQSDAGPPDGLGSEDGGRQAGLHVSRAAAVEVPVAYLTAERVDGPAFAGRHDVDVAVQVERGSRGATASPAQDVDLRTLRIVAWPAEVLGLEAVRLEPDAEELSAFPVGVAGRVDGRNADQLRRERRRLFAADRGLGQDAVQEVVAQAGEAAAGGGHGAMGVAGVYVLGPVVFSPHYYVRAMWIADRGSRSAGLGRLEPRRG